jgi:Ohr subfamily peroxiredoxin
MNTSIIDFPKQNRTVDKVVYTAKTHTCGGREGGKSHSVDGRLDIQLARPASTDRGTNPEQLFAAGWSACFIGALKVAAAKKKILLSADTSVDAEVDLCITGDIYVLRARLDVHLPDLDTEVAMALVEAAHQICPYSNATRGNIDVVISLI